MILKMYEQLLAFANNIIKNNRLYYRLTAIVICNAILPPPLRGWAPFVCFADIFPASGEINPHKCGGQAGTDKSVPYDVIPTERSERRDLPMIAGTEVP